jgi:hypothetical protein
MWKMAAANRAACLLVARLRHPAMSVLRSLSVEKPTSCGQPVSVANDPMPTFLTLHVPPQKRNFTAASTLTQPRDCRAILAPAGAPSAIRPEVWIHAIKPAGSQVGCSCDSGTFALFVGYHGKAAELGTSNRVGRPHGVMPGRLSYALDCPALRGDIVRIVTTLHDG